MFEVSMDTAVVECIQTYFVVFHSTSIVNFVCIPRRVSMYRLLTFFSVWPPKGYVLVVLRTRNSLVSLCYVPVDFCGQL